MWAVVVGRCEMPSCAVQTCGSRTIMRLHCWHTPRDPADLEISQHPTNQQASCTTKHTTSSDMTNLVRNLHFSQLVPMWIRMLLSWHKTRSSINCTVPNKWSKNALYCTLDLWITEDQLCYWKWLAFYCAMHYSAKRGLGITCRLSVHLWHWWIMTI